MDEGSRRDAKTLLLTDPAAASSSCGLQPPCLFASGADLFAPGHRPVCGVLVPWRSGIATVAMSATMLVPPTALVAQVVAFTLMYSARREGNNDVMRVIGGRALRHGGIARIGALNRWAQGTRCDHPDKHNPSLRSCVTKGREHNKDIFIRTVNLRARPVVSGSDCPAHFRQEHAHNPPGTCKWSRRSKR